MRKPIKIKMKCSDYFFVVCIFLTLILFFKILDINQELQTLQKEIEQRAQTITATGYTQTEYTQTIDFLENEFTKYRESVKDHLDFLKWLIGLAGTFLTGLFAFFHIKGKEDIADLIKEHYSNQIQEEITDFVGGQKKVAYLQRCIEKEEQAQNKKILFLLQSKVNESLMKVHDILVNQNYCVKQKSVSAVSDKEIVSLAREYDIIVYQVDESEYVKNTKDKDVTYARLSKECNRKGVYCVLYCEDNRGLDRELYNSYFYISNANYGLTVLERIFNLLFFS